VLFAGNIVVGGISSVWACIVRLYGRVRRPNYDQMIKTYGCRLIVSWAIVVDGDVVVDLVATNIIKNPISSIYP
jgi:hypothetical protein